MKSLLSTSVVPCSPSALRVARGFMMSVALLGFVACSDDAPPKTSWVTEEMHEASSSMAPGIRPKSAEEVRNAAETAAIDALDNSAPRIAAVRFDPPNPVVGDTIRAAVDVTDPDGGTPFVQYSWTRSGIRVGGNVPKLVLKDARKGDRIELEVTASDGQAASDVEVVWVVIENAPPSLRKVDVEPGSEISAGQTITLRPEARDPDGDAVEFRYRWEVNGQRVSVTGAMFDTAELERGDQILATVVATDGETDSEPLETPTFTLTNTPPSIVSWPGAPGRDGTFNYQVRAEDPDGGNLMYKLAEAPAGMKIGSQTGAIRWEPKPDQIGSYTVAIVVDDLEGGQTQQVFELSTTAPDAPPAKPASSE